MSKIHRTHRTFELITIRNVALGASIAGALLAAPAVTRAADPPAAIPVPGITVQAKDPHATSYTDDQFPSAKVCKNCHEEIFWEWASSNHAYASISPMFHKFEQRITELASGTIGTFCVRCHQQVGTQRGEPREQPLWERSKISSEGITCITCHRVNEQFGKVNGERNVLPGTINEPMYGGPGSEIEKVLKDVDYYKVDATGTGRGNKIHAGAITFDQITKSEFCAGCHQVAVHPGIKLEVVWDQYRDSPAMARGVTCQECHMGKTPGRPDGYVQGPAAVVNGQAVGNRAHHNHAFYGPGYPIAHPGIFPHNPDGDRWSYQDWLKYDFRAGWGTDEFEDLAADADKAFDSLDKAVKANDAAATRAAVADLGKVAQDSKSPAAKPAYAKLQAATGPAVAAAAEEFRKAAGLAFPPEWSDTDDRADARKVVTKNIELLEQKRKLRQAVMENGSRIDGPFFRSTPSVGSPLRFSYKIVNTDDGHNLPSGSLGAQPEIWVNVALVDPDGKTVFESGYVDSIGDMADLHSDDVLNGRVPHDDQLVNLQTKFLTTNVKGTEREMYLPINLDVDQLPFIRPANVPTTVLNHPPNVRMEQRSIPPLGSKTAEYTAPSSAMLKPGVYKLAIRLRSRAEPIYFMRFVRATLEMEQAMNEWMIDIHPQTVEFEVK
jgi:hypothetical protein